MLRLYATAYPAQVDTPPHTQEARLAPRNVRNDNFLQRLLVTWVYPIVTAGRAGTLQQDALCMPLNQATEVASARFFKEWNKEKQDAAAAAADASEALDKHSPQQQQHQHQQAASKQQRPPRHPSVARALWRSFGGEFALAGCFKLLWSGFVLLGASYFVNALIEFVQGKMVGGDALPGKGVGWVSGGVLFVGGLWWLECFVAAAFFMLP